MKTLIRFISRLFAAPAKKELYGEKTQEIGNDIAIYRESPEFWLFKERWMV